MLNTKIQYDAPIFYFVFFIGSQGLSHDLRYAQMRITIPEVKWTFYIFHFLYILLLSLFGYYTFKTYFENFWNWHSGAVLLLWANTFSPFGINRQKWILVSEI
jgi:hypothetical protein